MPTQWQNQYTDLSNVNNGNELQNGDDILANHVNVALENGAYAKKRTDELNNDISAQGARITTLEGKNLYTHNITITATTASSVTLPTGWSFSSFTVKFQFVSTVSTTLDTKPQLRPKVLLNTELMASGFVQLVDTNDNHTASIITNVKFSGTSSTITNVKVFGIMYSLVSGKVLALDTTVSASSVVITDDVKVIN